MAAKVAIIGCAARKGGEAAAVSRVGRTETADIEESLTGAGFTPLPLEVSPDLAETLRRENPEAAFVVCDDRRRNAEIRELLDMLGTAYVGPDAYAVRRTCDKRWVAATLEDAVAEFCCDYKAPQTLHVPSLCIREAGIPTALDAIERAFPNEYPLEILGDAETGAWSAVVVPDTEALRDCLRDAARGGDGVMVRPAAEGLGVSVFVYGDAEGGYGTLGPLQAARQGNGAVEYAPLELSKLGEDPCEAEPIRSEIERAALDCFCACGLRGIARIDLVWNGGVSVFAGLDPVPAFEAGSPLATACKASGTSVQDVIRTLVILVRGGDLDD